MSLLLALLAGCGGASSVEDGATGEVVTLAPDSALTAAPASGDHCPDAPGPIPDPIVFGSDSNLLSISEEGGEATPVTALPTTMWASDPAWSPDGSTLLYTLNAPSSDPDLSWLGVGKICALDRNTGQGRLLAKAESEIDSLVEATWTPDGKALVLTLQRAELDSSKQYLGSKSTVARYDLETNTLQALVEEGSSPAVSSDGELLSYIETSPETAATALMVADPSGKEARSLLPPSEEIGLISAPRWSPDSKQIVFTASGDAAGNSPEGSPARSLLERLLGISVVKAHGAPSNLWIVGADGEELRKVTREALDDPRAAWSPDGRQVAYAVGTGGVFLLDFENGVERPLSEKGNYGGITWAAR